MTTTNVRLEFSSITCQETRDASPHAEPYLWPVFFRVDNDPLREVGQFVERVRAGEIMFIPPGIVSLEAATKAAVAVNALPQSDVAWCRGTRGGRGNLGGGFAKGEKRDVPEDVGGRTMAVLSSGLTEPSVRVGYGVVLMEEDTLPRDSDMLKGYDTYVSEFRSAVWNSILDNMLGRVKSDVERLVEAAGLEVAFNAARAAGIDLTPLVEAAMQMAGVDDLNSDELSDAIATLALSRKVRAATTAKLAVNDDFIFARVRTWLLTDLIEMRAGGQLEDAFVLTADTSKGKYKLEGRLRLLDK